jgi:hypothetical protein
LTYDAEDAIAVGLADQTGSLDDEIALFVTELNPENGDHTMADKDTKQEDMVSKADHESALAAARTEAKAEGMTEANRRIDDILGSEEAKTRPSLATRLLKSSMSADEAIAFMKDSPEEKAETPAGDPKETAKEEGNGGNKDHFSDFMDKEGGAGVSAQAPAGDDQLSDDEKATREILGAHGDATGLVEVS